MTEPPIESLKRTILALGTSVGYWTDAELEDGQPERIGRLGRLVDWKNVVGLKNEDSRLIERVKTLRLRGA